MLTSKCSTICLAYFPTCPAYLSTSGVLAAISPHRGISGAIYTSEQETPLRKKRFQHTRAGLNLLLKTPHMILRYPEECKARKGRTIIIWCLSSWGLAPVAWARAYAIKLYLVFFQKNDLGRWPRITPLFMIHLGDLGYVKGSWVYKYILRNWNWGSGSFDYSISLSDWWNIFDHSCQMAAMQEVNPEFSNLDITMVG